MFEIAADPADFSGVRDDLEARGMPLFRPRSSRFPMCTIRSRTPKRSKMEKLLDMLDDNDDVQSVWHNWDRPEEDEED